MKISLLQQMYKDILVGIPLAKESHHYISLLNLCVEQPPGRDESCNRMHLPSTNGGMRSHQDADMSNLVVPTTDDTSNSFANVNSSFCPREVMLLQLTLIKMMVAKAESQEIEFSTRQKYCEIFALLLKEAKIDSKLICLLGSYDQLLSHMASKSLASLVYFQLKEENALNVTWLTFSLKTLSGFPVNTQVAECLWTLTTIIKDMLKDEVLTKAGILKKLLAPLDAVLEGFYNSILFHHFDSHHYTSPYSEAANNLISFIDLLEALLASRIELELPLRCQRVLFLKVSYILTLISSSIHYLIKKKLIMLLKKCVLYKSREDAKSGSLFLQNPSLYEDMLALSNAVLQVVNLAWLNQIPLSEKASYFGGSETVPGDGTQGGSDQTVLRALSLVVLKALEFKFQNSATEAEIKGDFQSSMSQLLLFWRSHLKASLQFHPVVHHCEWVSLIFIEQDDDMWEAAKALLLIYLKFDRLRHDAADNLSQKEEETWNFLTHASAYNPHCIFLFFLEKIAFDSTVLLDFLISSETCFLEYLVRYLKLLSKDWHQFVDVCNGFDTKDGTFQSISSVKQEKQSCMTVESLQNACCEPEPQTLVALAASHSYLVFTTEQGDNEVVESNQSNSLICTDSTSLLGSLQSLVNYDSSEDSELESDGKECLVDTKQVPLNNEGKVMIRETVCSYTDDKQNTLKCEVLPLKQKGSNTLPCLTCTASLDNVIPLRTMLYTSTKCLEELQKAISRLQRRNLFPYNPSALLKLLSHVEKISKNVNPQ
ncbi:protein Lines homolog 1 isoform X1 [Haliaeetus albicilla]|uniref:LINES protein n=2 Tax=Haliaeetus albicilla TaxID=8969 RepID=A0A091NUS9_HALAL|nr:PREDICTED: protein Lines homolog isoform X1 [Haliaeetus albicilla]XP_009916754.1 PREDICTED: protein Lines homolog isoform X1 [Haliaeetus albicilla]XP_009916761.1 PREDICTED: protein Lines homolog isoform X1 [Haliaeetus albicilla]KFP96525.1 Protein Lines [Haliaeetus albicilla]NWZ53270.1 LINES protein [Haliaeetus albicilla]